MTPDEIKKIREDFNLSQVQFSQLFGVHPITVSKWERGVGPPSPWQDMLLNQFKVAAKNKENRDTLGGVLLGMGVAVALAMLLEHLNKK